MRGVWGRTGSIVAENDIVKLQLCGNPVKGRTSCCRKQYSKASAMRGIQEGPDQLLQKMITGAADKMYVRVSLLTKHVVNVL